MRELDTATLGKAVDYYRAAVMLPGRRARVLASMWNFSFKDEFEAILAEMKRRMAPGDWSEFQRDAANVFEPRRDEVLEAELSDRLAVRPDGTHIEGARGRVSIGTRVVGFELHRVLTPAYTKRVSSLMRRYVLQNGTLDWDGFRDYLADVEQRGGLPEQYVTKPFKKIWQVYAGEEEERAAGRVGPGTPIDELPGPEIRMALDPGISNEAAIAACDAITARVDEGSTAATIRGRTGTQPADVDASETGTLLFTLTMSDPAFAAAADANPGGRATASAITADSSADATGALTYCRIGATGTGADDHIDGSGGVSSGTFDFEFNTDAIVSGANVEMTSLTVTVPETN